MSEAALLARARSLAGYTVGAVAAELGERVPGDLRGHKGFVGELIEHALGATGTGREVDFPDLGIELKTVPVRSGRPAQSTWVCSAPLDGSLAVRWEQSWVRQKLAAVLFVPVDSRGPVAARRLGAPRLWRPSVDEDALLARDWAVLAELIHLGELWRIDARLGEVLQLRPKAASRDQRVWVVDSNGEWVKENPRGFYLRPAFVGAVLERLTPLGPAST